MLDNTITPSVSLDDDHQQRYLSLASATGPSYSDEHLDDLSQKYDAAMGPVSPGAISIQSAISNNNQDRLGELLNMQKGLQLENARNSFIQTIANQNSGNASPEAVSAVRNLTTQELTSSDPGTALEQQYSKIIQNEQLDAVNTSTNGSYDQAITSDPKSTNAVLDAGEAQGARNMISNNIYQSLKKQYDDSNILVKGQAWLQEFVPFRSWAAMDNFLGQSVLPTSIIPGDSVQQQVSWLHTLPPDQYKTYLQNGVDKLVGQGDYLDAMQFVEATLSYGADDKNLQNIFAAADVAGVLPAGKIAEGLGRVLKGSTLAVNVPLKEVETAAKVSQLEGTAVDVAASNAISQGLPINSIKAGPDVERVLGTFARPAEAFTNRPTRASAEVINRLAEAAQTRTQAAIDMIAGTNKVDRIYTPEEVTASLNATKDTMKQMFNDQTSNIIDFIHTEPTNTTNFHSVTMVLGRKDGSYFPTKLAADNYASKYIKVKTGDYKTINNGTGWSVQIPMNVDETKAGLRTASIETENAPGNTFGNRVLKFINTYAPFTTGADTKLSAAQQAARSSVVMGVERNEELLKDFAKPIAYLQKDKQGFKEWNDFLVSGRDRETAEVGKGPFYHTLADFEDAWYARYNKTPTEAQMDAYMSFKQWHDTDFMIRSLSKYQQQATLGLEKFSAKHLVLDKGGDLKAADPVEFEGKQVSDIPFGSESEWNIGLLDEEGVLRNGQKGFGIKTFSKYMTEEDAAKLRKELKDGNYTIVQAANGFQQIDDKYFNFLALKNFKRDRVSMDLSYPTGLRDIQKHPYYIKQAKVSISDGRARYLGDNAIANARDAEDGKTIVDKLEQFRQLMKEQSARGNKFSKTYPAKAFFENNFPMWDYADFSKRITDGDIKLDVPFQLTRSGNRVLDHGSLLDALRAEGHKIEGVDTGNAWRLNNQVKGRFLGDRLDSNLDTLTTEKNSIFKLETDSTLSPLETLKLSMGDAIDINLMNDYKIRSVRDFTQQFGKILEGTSGDFQQNGLKYIFHPVYKSGASKNEIAQAEAVRKSILSLWQHTTPVDRALGTYKEKIIKSLRNSLGDDVADWADDRALPRIAHADGFMRWFAYHTKMGFFNPKQLFTQASTIANIVAISPKYGSKAGMLLSPMMLGLKATDEQLLKGIGAKLGSFIGVKPEDYVELVNMYKRSGFDIVGGDVAYLDDLSPPKVIQSGVNKALDTGLIFFKTGERMSRMTAFAAAYLERKVAGNALTRTDEQWILKRAKDMTGNMTRDSNAPYQQGWTAVASQFFGYQMRLMEQMMGSKLSTAEKARLFTATSLIYGVPSGLGLTFGVAPMREWMKSWLRQEGVQTDNTILEPFVDGFASEFLKAMTGTSFDVASSYGPSGINNFGDLVTGDASLFNLIAGASGGIIWQAAADSDPIIKGLFSLMNPFDKDKFPILAQDWLQPLSEISSANTVIKLWKAINMGALISKNENKMTNTTPLEDWITATLSVVPQRVSDAFSDISAMNTIKAEKSSDEKQMVADYRRGVLALKAGDKGLAQTYFNRVIIRGHSAGFNPNDFQQMYRRAMKDTPLDESVLQQINKMFQGNN